MRKLLSMVAVGLLLQQAASAGQLVVSGRAHIEGGGPVRIGTILVTELTRRSNAMPSSRYVGRTVTSLEGNFEIKFNYHGGDLDLQLIDDHCAWRSGYILIRHEALKGKRTYDVELVPMSDDCEKCNEY